ncbi:Rpr2-domain-containing protein [Phlegmacium glaucopus]|nr:Rpr2-domain-containing protein [Phlegmacium glaucopus]
MGKKQKDDLPNVNATPNRDIIQRLNFLYQASVYLQSIELPIPIEDGEAHPNLSGNVRSKAPKLTQSSVKKKHTLRRKVRGKQTTGDLARSYVQCMRVVGQKTTVKIDPALKRSLCSSCSTTLIPGSSASVRVKKSSSHGHLVIYTCLHCHTSKSIPAPPTLPLNPATRTEEIEGRLLNASTAVAGTSERPDISGPLAMASPSQSQVPKEKKKKLIPSSPPPRLLPLFARPDAGHVLFKGNEVVVLDESSGLGVCFV